MNTDTSYSHIKTSIENNAFIVMIDRESKMNALNIELLKEIETAVTSVQDDPGIRGIIITGAGAKAFAAGADIAEFAGFTPEEAEKMSREGHNVMNTIENSRLPVIAAVNGYALGGGCELAMACHIRVVSPNAVFGQPEVNLGVPPGYGGTQRLAQIIGKGLAAEMLITGNNMNAERAKETGLANQIVEQEELMPACIRIIEKLAFKSPAAIGKVIKCLNDLYEPVANGMETEIREFASAFQTADFNEGTAAFLEKRKPDYQ